MKSFFFVTTIVALASLTGCARLRQCGWSGFASNADCQECSEHWGEETPYESQYIPSGAPFNGPELPPLEEVAPPAV